MAKQIEGRRIALWRKSTSLRFLVGWLVGWYVAAFWVQVAKDVGNGESELCTC